MNLQNYIDNGWTAARSVLVTAESWKQLRRGDVYRLFDSHDDCLWSAILKELKTQRPDLVDEAREVMADLEADLYGGTCSPEY